MNLQAIFIYLPFVVTIPDDAAAIVLESLPVTLYNQFLNCWAIVTLVFSTFTDTISPSFNVTVPVFNYSNTWVVYSSSYTLSQIVTVADVSFFAGFSSNFCIVISTL